jgi:two-component sensor histidine kinase
MEAIARGERSIESELRLTWPDGSPRWLLLRAELQDIKDGMPRRTIGVALDITERKKAEEHQQLLINELNHRVKNTLATVQSITTQSLRNAETANDARNAVEGRLFALSRAHDVLTRENWDGAFIREVVQEAIAPFQGHGQGRFGIRGEEVRLPPRIALAIAMALQELGTNAVKYGALSNETGQIAIRWTVVSNAEGPRLEMIWQETGGPLVVPPSRRGFGTRLIERSLAQELHGDVSIAFAPSGVICTINALLSDDEKAGRGPA